jgi:hypothetical protein
MSRLVIPPGARLHMLVWRAHPSAPGDPGGRAARAIDGCPISFGDRFDTWAEAIAAAIARTS